MTTKVILYFPSDATDKAVAIAIVDARFDGICPCAPKSRRDVRARCSSN